MSGDQIPSSFLQETLHETLINLDSSRRLEARMRQETLAILEALRSLGESTTPAALYTRILHVFAGLLEVKHGCLLSVSNEEQVAVIAQTQEGFTSPEWLTSDYLDRVTWGEILSIADVSVTPLAWLSTIDASTRSCLLVPVSTQDEVFILVLLSPDLGFFCDEHIAQVRRFIPLAEQAVERSKLMNQLASAEERHRIVVGTLADGVVTIDNDGKIVSANAAACDIFKQPHLTEREISSVVVKEQKGAIDLAIKSNNHGNHEFFCVRADGTRFPCEMKVRHTHLQNQRINVVVVRDLTEVRRSQQTALQSQKLESIGSLAAGIAHELNTPIQYVRDNTLFFQQEFDNLAVVLQLLVDASKRQSLGTEEATMILESVKEFDLDYLLKEIPAAIKETLSGAEAVARIVRSMKQFSHPGDEVKRMTDLNGSIESTVEVSRNEWKYVAELELSLEQGLPAVSCFPGEINQVLLNLIVNAAHAVEDSPTRAKGTKGAIKVVSRNEGTQVVIEISDTGCGIPAEHHAKVFDPFFTTKAVGKGTGQGLALAYATIVERHQGEISFVSTVGKGTTFKVVLPISGRQNK